MTSEQNEAWQKGIMAAYPAPVSDGQECTLEQWQEYRRAEAAMVALLPEAQRFAALKGGVKDSVDHLIDWNLPDWAFKTREYCARRHDDRWANDPDFAFRSDVALVGLQVRYPMQETSAEPYQRVLVGFLSGVLRPLVEYAEANNDTKLRHDLEGYYQICCLCESDGHYRESQRWLYIQNTFGISWSRVTCRTRTHFLVPAITRFARRILLQDDEPGDFRSIERLLFHLYIDYQEFCLPSRIAQAFLRALEDECPPPDWLPLP